MEIMIKTFLKGMKISEVSTIGRDRRAGTLKFKLLNWLPSYFHWQYCRG